MTPTAELADIVLPVASAFESEALKIGFEVSEEAQSLVQLRPRVVPPRGEARSDLAIVFELADRLGLGEHFWDGDIEAALPPPARAERDHPRGAARQPGRACACRSPRATASTPRPATACPRLRDTVAAKVELYSRRCSTTATRRCPSSTSRASRPLAARPRGAFPAGPHLREGHAFLRDPAPQRREPAPPRARPAGRAAPDLAAARGIAAGDWVRISTPARQRPRPRPAQRLAWTRTSSAASTAGGRPARSSARPATPRSAPTAPTSTSSSTAAPSTRSAARRRIGHLSAR